MRRFPVLGTTQTIPWHVAERAYAEFRLQFGLRWTLEQLCAGGGLMPEELDAALPRWREESRARAA